MPPVEPRPRTSTFKLTLRRFLRPFTRRSHRPQTPPPTTHTAHHRVGVWRKMGRAPDCPCAQKCVSAIWGPSPLIFINMQVSEVLAMCQRVRRQIDLGQLRTIDMRVDLRGRISACPRSPVAHGGLRRPQAYGWQRSDAAYGDGAPPVPPGARSAHRWHGCPGATDGGRSYLKKTAEVSVPQAWTAKRERPSVT